jgi:predicted membrane protein
VGLKLKEFKFDTIMSDKKLFIKNLFIVLFIVATIGFLGNLQKEKQVSDTQIKVDKGAEADFSITGLMSKRNKEVRSKDFNYGEINCMMSSVDVDFSNADIKEEAQVDINAMMGGVRIFVPKDWTVNMDVVAIMGGSNDNKADSVALNPNKILHVNGFVMMGGVEIKRLP